jgi:hypothetical protein
MEHNNPQPVTTEDLIVVIRKDCLHQAKQAHTKLTEAVRCLEDDDHLGALGAIEGLGDEIACLGTFLKRIAWFTGMPPRPL